MVDIIFDRLAVRIGPYVLLQIQNPGNGVSGRTGSLRLSFRFDRVVLTARIHALSGTSVHAGAWGDTIKCGNSEFRIDLCTFGTDGGV